jgi:DNA invertase Pin-like site-specific DNA recombinase
MRYFSYVRVSTDAQNTASQKALIRDWAKKNSVEFDKKIEIKISSRESSSKRGVDGLIDELKSGDVLVVAELSRLGRSMLETLNIIDTLNKKGVFIEL